MSPIAFKNFRSTQTTLDLNGPVLSITDQPTNVITQPSTFQTPFGPATGALPIRNTDDAATVALDTFRADSNADQLVLAMPFNNSPQGGDVSSLVRGSGTNKNTTDYGDVAVSTEQSIFYGASYYFDGEGDYVFVDSNPDFAFGTGDFCVEFWVRRSTTAKTSAGNSIIQSDTIPSTGTAATLAEKWWISVDGDNISFNTHGGSGIPTGTTFPTTTDRWYHIAITRQSNTLYMFGDGRLMKTVSGYSYNLDQNGLTIAGVSTPYYFKGYLQGVRIYKGVAKYTSDFIPAFPTPDLVSSSLVGISTFVGITTVTLATPNTPGDDPSTGSLAYQWYDDSGALTDGTNYPNGTSGPKNITGAGTSTLTLDELASPADNGRTFYQKSTYASTTYINGRSTGKAWNGPLQTNTVKLTVIPNVTITSQPVGISIGRGEIVTFTSGASTTDTTFGDLTYYWTIDGTVIGNEGTDDPTNLEDFVGGATTPILRIKKNVVGVSTVQFHAYQDADGYRVESKSVGVAFTGVTPRRMVKFEAFTAITNLIEKEEKNIGEDGALTVDSSTFGSDYGIIQFYSPEDNYNLRMTIQAAAGAANGTYSGGEGGTSVIDLRLDKIVEYTVIGLSDNSAIFIYRGAQLIAAVGKGGDAGTTANGGPGGGVGMAGESGSGKDGGTGGVRISTGNLDLTGVWGSRLAGSNVSLYEGDIIAGTPNGGRTISCSRGSYWINQGIGACDNVSDAGGNYVSFRYPDGTLASTSEDLIRGFKSGYTVSQTSGLAINNGGNGGNGCTGGQGGVGGSGGGGGSGYSDDSFTVVSTTLGGNTSTISSIKFEVAV